MCVRCASEVISCGFNDLFIYLVSEAYRGEISVNTVKDLNSEPFVPADSLWNHDHLIVSSHSTFNQQI